MIFIAHFTLTCAMTGLIWFVQLIHYPLFLQVPAAAFVPYENEHTRRAGILIGPMMLAELGTGLALLASWRPWELILSMVILLLVWISTFAIQVPLHRRLQKTFDTKAAILLIRTNWIRTIGWSLRAILLAWLAAVTWKAP
jgi:hypothetical protein